MKADKYSEDLAKVIAQAKDKWDLERMRIALIEQRAIIESRLYKMKQEEFAQLKSR